jgi:nucleoside permease NupC
VLECVGEKVHTFLGYTDVGSEMLYGYLSNQAPFIPQRLDEGSLAYNVTMEINEHKAVHSILTFKALSAIYFFSFFVSILFHYGVMQVTTIYLCI